MKYLLNLLLVFFVSSKIFSQVIQVTYQEELEFAYTESESLIEQLKNDDVIKAEYSYGYEVGKGGIRYIFDFNNMKVKREEDNGDGIGFRFVDEWDIAYVISPWNENTEHLSCVAITPYGEYFYEINTFSTGSRCLLKSCKNEFNLDIENLPNLDWNTYNIGELSTEFGEFSIKVIQ
jgi:hypothetical protein